MRHLQQRHGACTNTAAATKSWLSPLHNMPFGRVCTRLISVDLSFNTSYMRGKLGFLRQVHPGVVTSLDRGHVDIWSRVYSSTAAPRVEHRTAEKTFSPT